jgi:hypothetical protein
MDKSSAGTWVKVISILGYIGAVVLFLLGILLFVGKSILGAIPQFSGMIGSIGAILIVAAIITIIIGIFEFIVALNLWKYKNWARIVMFVLAAIGFILSITSIVSSTIMSIIGLIIEGGVFYLLAINKDVVKLFK